MHWSRESVEPRNKIEPQRREDRKGNAKKVFIMFFLALLGTTGSRRDHRITGGSPASW